MVFKDDLDAPARRSHQFLVRMWPEDEEGGKADWRGSVRHVQSGEVRYFRDWQTLEAFVEGLLRQAVGDVTGDR